MPEAASSSGPMRLCDLEKQTFARQPEPLAAKVLAVAVHGRRQRKNGVGQGHVVARCPVKVPAYHRLRPHITVRTHKRAIRLLVRHIRRLLGHGRHDTREKRHVRGRFELPGTLLADLCAR